MECLRAYIISLNGEANIAQPYASNRNLFHFIMAFNSNSWNTLCATAH